MLNHDFIPGKGYKKACKNCGKEFYGRKNRFYCHEECKSAYNNNKAAKKKKKRREEFRPFEKNYEILKKFLPKGEEGIHPDVLREFGFKDDDYTKRKFDEEKNIEYLIIRDLAYYVRNGKVYILNFKNHENTNRTSSR